MEWFFFLSSETTIRRPSPFEMYRCQLKKYMSSSYIFSMLIITVQHWANTSVIGDDANNNKRKKFLISFSCCALSFSALILHRSDMDTLNLSWSEEWAWLNRGEWRGMQKGEMHWWYFHIHFSMLKWSLWTCFHLFIYYSTFGGIFDFITRNIFVFLMKGWDMFEPKLNFFEQKLEFESKN